MIIGKIELISIFLIIKKIFFKTNMSKIVIIGAGAMGSAFSFPCIDNNHDTTIIGTHLENNFIDKLKNNRNLHPGLNVQIPESIKILKFDKFYELFKPNIDLIVLELALKELSGYQNN